MIKKLKDVRNNRTADAADSMESSSGCSITTIIASAIRPPHFHVIYQENEALIDIKTLEILEGRLPKRAKSLAIEWAIEHRDELMTNWQKARSHETLDRIEPLD